MKPLCKKAALSAVAAGALAGVSMDSSAMITGSVGEALLVPLVVANNNLVDDVNTVITFVAPAVVNYDTVPNFFTAPNTTPGAGDFTGANGAAHWYFFDARSIHRRNEAIPVTPNDYTQISWIDVVDGTGLEGVPGYLVIGTESARPAGGVASFDMYGDAQLVLDGPLLGIRVADIPVLPMSDGVDASPCVPIMPNQVCYRGSGTSRVPDAVSPLAAGVRMNWQDGDLLDLTNVDFAMHQLSDATFVMWLDGNYDDAYTALDAEVYDANEIPCSLPVDAPNELNIIQVFSTGIAPTVNWPFNGVTAYENVCGAPFNAFMRVTFPEMIDGTPAFPVAQSGVFFSLLWRSGAFFFDDYDLFTVPAGELGIDRID